LEKEGKEEEKKRRKRKRNESKLRTHHEKYDLQS
jgi:hypothetical protein